MPPVPSSSAVTPNEWNDIPSLTTSNSMRSPASTSIVGLWPGSPGCALNDSTLKSADSTNDSATSTSTPVSSTSTGAGPASPAMTSTTGGVCDIQ